ncbi:hypothetical protein [Emticicia sp. 17c]|uniref:hypothetical protein n=1 Tax=Emticicia sp. 17c TaxID=3127704 RepID=UPI00301D7120
MNTTIGYQEEDEINSLTIICLAEGNWSFANSHVASLQEAQTLIEDYEQYKPVSKEFFEDRVLLFLTPLMLKCNLLSLEDESE